MYFTLLAAGASENYTGAGVTAYLPFSGWFGLLDSTFATETQNQTIVAAPFEMSNLFVRMASAPGIGFSRTFTVRKNGADTGITVTLADNAEIGFDYTHRVSFNTGDLISIKETCVGSPQAGTYSISALGNGPAQQIACSCFAISGSMDVGATDFMPPMGGKFPYSSESNAEQVVPAAGTLNGLRVLLLTAPGGSASYTITLRKNGSPTALSVTITGGSTTGFDTSHPIAVAKGDIISFTTVPSGTPADCVYYCFAMAFTPTTPGDAIYGVNMGGASTTVPGYSTPYGGFGGWNAADVNAAYFEPGPGIIKNLYAVCVTAPGGSASWALKLRKHFTDTSLAVTITGASTTAESTGKVVYQPGDELTVSVVPAGTPAAVTGHLISWTLNQPGSTGFLGLL